MEEPIKTERNYRELLVLSLVPGIVGALILASWALAAWHIGPLYLNAGLALVATLFGGSQRFVTGFKDMFNRKITVNVFVVVALIATMSIGEFRPAAIIVFIMAVVGAFETYTMDKNRQSIRNLLDLTPRTATIRRGKEEVSVPICEVAVGDIVLVGPGDRIPVDGVVVSGTSSVDQAPITGESIPVDKFKGSELFSGTLNVTGRLEERATKVGADTTLARIVHLVEEAQTTKAPIQAVADRFTVWFLPTVLLLAIGVYFTTHDIRVAVSILLVACPCAFAIATPTAVTAGISVMARRGVLVKGGMFFELAGKIDALVVDKTGTFTMGQPKVSEIVAFDGVSEADVLRVAAIGEKFSEHPVSRAVTALAKERHLEVPDPDDFQAEIGMGVTARWNNTRIAVGKEEYLRGLGITISAAAADGIAAQMQKGRTTLAVAQGDQLVGLIAVADEVRPETAGAITALHRVMGNENITMLTGDNELVARSVAQQIGVRDYKAGLLPDQKQAFVKALQEKGHTVCMIGDGINDAPALALADVGVAMGAAGTDIAIDTADVTLMNDDLSRVVEFMLMSRKVFHRIKLNIFFSIIYNVIGIVLGAFGMLTPIWAISFQEAGCVTVVFSSMQLLWAKPQLHT